MRILPEAGEKTPQSTNEDSFEAARRVAMVLANEGEPGFDLVRTVRRMGELPDQRKNREIPNHGERVAWETLYRLFLLSDHERVPRLTRRAASKVGGVSLNPSEIRHGDGTMPCGVVLNHAYARLCTDLKKMYWEWKGIDRQWEPPAWLKAGSKAFIFLENEQTLAWTVSAALSSADQMLALEEFCENRSDHWKRRWNEQIGGGHAHGDPVTPWINAWLSRYRENGCPCDACKSAGYNVTDFRAVGRKIDLNDTVQERCSADRANGASSTNAAQIPLQSKTDLHTPVPAVSPAPDPPMETEAAPHQAAENTTVQASRSYYGQFEFVDYEEFD